MKSFGILPTVREWWDGVLADDKKDVFDFPPGKTPRISKLADGDRCFISLYDEGVLIGEVKVKRVAKVDRTEFMDRFFERTVRVSGIGLPTEDQFVWVVEFYRDSLKPFRFPLDWILIGTLYKSITGKSLGPAGGVSMVYDLDRYDVLYSIIKFLGYSNMREFSIRVDSSGKKSVSMLFDLL